MNQDQRKILKFLSKQDAQKFMTQEEIAKKTKLSSTTIGSECYKLREEGYVEPGLARFNEPLDYRITVKGQNQLDEEDSVKVNLKWTKLGTIAAIIISSIALIISVIL